MTIEEQSQFNDLQARATQAEGAVADLRAQLESEQRAHVGTKEKLIRAEGEARNAASRVTERFARMGIVGIPKETPEALDGLAGGDAALLARYMVASWPEKSRMLDQYGTQLTRAAEAHDRERGVR